MPAYGHSQPVFGLPVTPEVESLADIQQPTIILDVQMDHTASLADDARFSAFLTAAFNLPTQAFQVQGTLKYICWRGAL